MQYQHKPLRLDIVANSSYLCVVRFDGETVDYQSQHCARL